MGPKKRVSKVNRGKATNNLKTIGKKKESTLRQTRLHLRENELTKVPKARLWELQRRKRTLLNLEAELIEKNAFLFRRVERYANPDRWELKEREEYENILLPLVNQWKEHFGFVFSKVKSRLLSNVEDMEQMDTWSLEFSFGGESYNLDFVAPEKDGSFEIVDVTITVAQPKTENIELRNLLDDCAQHGKLTDIFFIIRKYQALKLARQQIVDELTEKWEDSEIFLSAFNVQTGALEIFIGPKESFLFKVTIRIGKNSAFDYRLAQTSSIEYGIGGIRRCQSAGFTDSFVQEKLETDLFGLLNDLLKVSELTE